MCTFKCCGTFCAGFSIFCAISLILTGIFLAMESHSIAVPIRDNNLHPDYQYAAKNCFVGAAIYGVILLLSVGCIVIDRFRARNRSLNASQPLLNQQ